MSKDLLKKLAHRVGYQIRRTPIPEKRLLAHGSFTVLLDVGANTGQFVLEARKTGYAGRVVSFEPLPTAHAELARVASLDAGWLVHDRCALGDVQGTTKINLAANSVSSSILPMQDSHLDAAPDSRYIGAVETDVQTLDSIFRTYVRNGDKVYLKIDTQGYERPVLMGAIDALCAVHAVQMELSIVELYAGQASYLDLLQFMDDRGFTLWDIQRGFANESTGQMLQFDAVFYKSGMQPNQQSE
jgi:FkbM family methyltransferase